jgi:hypothetical protein
MKVRMEENSLRLRLKQKEVEQFSSNGKVSTLIKFGLHPNSFLQFSLIKDSSITIVQAIFEANEVSVLVPEHQANQWTSTEEEGFEGHMPLDKEEQLYILVEKDYRCLHKGPDHKDDVDCFPNPLEGKNRLDCN